MKMFSCIPFPSNKIGFCTYHKYFCSWWRNCVFSQSTRVGSAWIMQYKSFNWSIHST